MAPVLSVRGDSCGDSTSPIATKSTNFQLSLKACVSPGVPLLRSDTSGTRSDASTTFVEATPAPPGTRSQSFDGVAG